VLKYLLFLIVVGSGQILSADLLISPSDPKTDLTLSVHSDRSTSRILGFDFQLFNSTFNTLNVSENGNLTSSTTSDFYPRLLSKEGGDIRIAPLWDDFQAVRLEQIYEQKADSSYYSVTWKDVELALQSNTKLSTQVVLFGADTVLKGFEFKKNDIAFSYENVSGDFAGLIAEAGLRSSEGQFYQVDVPRLNDPARAGEIGFIPGSAAFSHLPWERNNFLLLRPTVTDSVVSYTVSIESATAVPEPSSMALIVTAILPWAWRISRRRYNSQHLPDSQEEACRS
jgi:hypothetical protein